jgi:hypothetical protein
MGSVDAIYPILWIGPAGSGKLTAARAALGATGVEPRLQTLMIGDYAARYWEFPTHMEVDIADLSMMDKQILPELLTQLLSTRDVSAGRRKLMILRRIHGLSPPAAVRLRAVLEELVWSPGAPAMVWCTTRTVNSVVLTLMDGFVYRRVAAPLSSEERPDRKDLLIKVGLMKQPPTISTYISEMLRQIVLSLREGPPTLAAVPWIRERVYDLLGLMITGADLVGGLTWATVRLAASGSLSTNQAVTTLKVLAQSRWIPSYRTPLMLEMILMSVYEAVASAA